MGFLPVEVRVFSPTRTALRVLRFGLALIQSPKNPLTPCPQPLRTDYVLGASAQLKTLLWVWSVRGGARSVSRTCLRSPIRWTPGSTTCAGIVSCADTIALAGVPDFSGQV